MPTQKIEHVTFPNGLTLVTEEMADVQSASFSLLIPAGSLHEPAGVNGTAAALCDLVTHGAGDLDHRQLSSTLDNLGVQRHEHVGWQFLSFGGSMLANNLAASLALFADVTRRPHLPEEEFDSVLTGLNQSLLAMEDEPQRKLATELRRRTYRDPWGRPTEGDLRELPNVTMATVRSQFERGFRPNGAILGIAGHLDVPALKEQVWRLFGDWQSKPEIMPVAGSSGPAVDHVDHPSTQVQIGIAFPAPAYGDRDYYAAWAAASILGGGPSARLFTEVRERRGLCYSVQASTHSLKTEGRTMVYAGTTTERAQETLDVTLTELRRLGDRIGQDELDRCKARAKSALIMQQESTAARASSIARDWYHLGRISTLDEVRHELEELTVDSILNIVRKYPPQDLTVLTVGPQRLNVAL